jgi:hypothetical protein
MGTLLLGDRMNGSRKRRQTVSGRAAFEENNELEENSVPQVAHFREAPSSSGGGDGNRLAASESGGGLTG